MTERLTWAQFDALPIKKIITLHLQQRSSGAWATKEEGERAGVHFNAPLEALLADFAYEHSEEFELLLPAVEMVTIEQAIEVRQRWTDRFIALLQERQTAYAERAHEIGVC